MLITSMMPGLINTVKAHVREGRPTSERVSSVAKNSPDLDLLDFLARDGKQQIVVLKIPCLIYPEDPEQRVRARVAIQMESAVTCVLQNM